jgi:hypothetical protein
MQHAIFIGALSALVLAAAAAQSAPTQGSPGAAMTQHASGTFEVKVVPLAKDEKVPGLFLARLSIGKQFQGDLQGTSAGEMMAPDSPVEGSGGYVAVEKVTGTLGGRSGSFVLLHQGTMKKGTAGFDLSIKVVPDSGTGQLTGLAGTMKIAIEGKKHSYVFDYTLPPGP